MSESRALGPFARLSHWLGGGARAAGGAAYTRPVARAPGDRPPPLRPVQLAAPIQLNGRTEAGRFPSCRHRGQFRQ
jgi:hypothetical protein